MLKFIDLFDGLGGFHLALESLGHQCVFASEIDSNLNKLYEVNYGIKPSGDIRKVGCEDIPSHDILCAGFPCQPFSKAGKRLGREDVNRGTLFDEIIRVLKYHQPRYFILENVPFLTNLDNKNTWNYMKSEFAKIGYSSDDRIYSPEQFGIPQTRKRVYIVGKLGGLENFNWVIPTNSKKMNIKNILEIQNESTTKIDDIKLKCLEIWQKFLNSLPINSPTPKFPIWSMEFGATYPFENGKNPLTLDINELSNFKGAFGQSLNYVNKEEQYKKLPKYSLNLDKSLNYPKWKQLIISKNRQFFQKYKSDLEFVIQSISSLPTSSLQKLEWNVSQNNKNIYEHIIQFRASGIRVKSIETAPTLVCNTTQIPIIGWEKRYISRNEGAKLQSMDGIKLPESNNACFKALGNAVNVEIIRRIAKNLLDL